MSLERRSIFFPQMTERVTAIFLGNKLLLPACGILTIFLVLASIRARRRVELVLLYASGIVGMIGGLIASFG